MQTITIPKKEYEALVDRGLRYEYLQKAIKEDVFLSPPEKNSKIVLKHMSAKGKYSKKFIKSLEVGLKRSSYFK